MQRIASLVIDNAIHKPRALEEIRAELGNSSTQLRAMKTIISMIQQNFDMGGLLSDVLRILNTSNYELKMLCNCYLKAICYDRPAQLLVCTNSFFSDFNDRNIKIQQLALIDSIELSDEVLIRKYINEIKRMVKHPCINIRVYTARCLSLIYLKNRALFYEENMINDLRLLLKDSENIVKCAALRAIYIIESQTQILTTEETIKTAFKFFKNGDSAGLRFTLSILKRKPLDKEMLNLLRKTVRSNDICVFYLSAWKILEGGKTGLEQEIYESAIEFMNVREEQQQNLLLFILSFLDLVKIDPKDFLIFSNDSDLIKMIKIDILIRKYKEFNEEEKEEVLAWTLGLLNENNSEYALKVLTSLIDSDFLNEELINVVLNQPISNDQLILLIKEKKDIIKGTKWREIVSKILFDTKETKYQKEYINLVSEFCDSIPPLFLEIIENLSDADDVLLVAKYLVQLYQRTMITKNSCIDYLTGMIKHYPLVQRLNIILDRIDDLDPEDIIRKDTFLFSPKDETLIQKELFLQENDKSSSHFKEECLAKLPIYIESSNFKGILKVDDGRLVLFVDSIEAPEILKFKIENIEHEEDILMEQKYSLFEITRELKGKECLIEISGKRYNIQVEN